jgi:adenosine/AMP kinase
MLSKEFYQGDDESALREECPGHPDDQVGIAFCESDFKRLVRRWVGAQFLR